MNVALETAYPHLLFMSGADRLVSELHEAKRTSSFHQPDHFTVTKKKNKKIQVCRHTNRNTQQILHQKLIKIKMKKDVSLHA